MKYVIHVLLLYFSFLMQVQSQQRTGAGRIDHLQNFSSQFVAARKIDIWLPEGYNGKTKYAVLYMHDGQMLFDSTTTWNRQSWNVDDVLTRLEKEKKIQNVIVVGVWNAGAGRHADYFPQRPFENMTATEKDSVIQQLQRAGRTAEIFQPKADSYLKFLVRELKPYIDNTYAVYPDRKHTFVAGSSMGGLISMYAICEYPEVFGGAACLSTHWPGTFTMENNPVPDAFLSYLRTHLPDPGSHKLYFDCGDQTLDALYPPIQHKVDEIMQTKGYNSKSWLTQYFPGKDHSEKSWNERLHVPLVFLLKP
jgi:enterochelin esterase-like enzyme